jgi:hypothetical protein
METERNRKKQKTIALPTCRENHKYRTRSVASPEQRDTV